MPKNSTLCCGLSELSELSECLRMNFSSDTRFISAAFIRYEVLNWMIGRREALADLDPQQSQSQSADFSQKELNMMCSALNESNESSEFWATCHLLHHLGSWGANVSKFFHACPLMSHFHAAKPCKNCHWKGRMSVRLAQGTWIDEFSQQLVAIPLGLATRFLRKLNTEKSKTLENDFISCKMAMAQRFLQSYSFWREIPWRLCAVALVLFDDSIPQDPSLTEKLVQTSKLFAQDCLDQWTGNSSKGNESFLMARKFMDKHSENNLVAYLVYWASSPDPAMPTPLALELLKYTSSLTVMQSLEAQHHFLNQKVSFGRASLPASTCAFLRRRVNNDVQETQFKENLSRLIGQPSHLVAVKCERRAELIQHVYGFSLDSMYNEKIEMQEKLLEAKSKFQRGQRLNLDREPLPPKEQAMRLEHVNAKLSSGKFYQLTKPDDGSQIVFQVVCKHPERRAYVQRVCLLGKDALWFSSQKTADFTILLGI